MLSAGVVRAKGSSQRRMVFDGLQERQDRRGSLKSVYEMEARVRKSAVPIEGRDGPLYPDNPSDFKRWCPLISDRWTAWDSGDGPLISDTYTSNHKVGCSAAPTLAILAR